MSGTYLLRTDADNEVGQGHLIRCLSLADELSRRLLRAIFILRHADTGARELITRRGYEAYYLATEHGYASEFGELGRLRLRYKKNQTADRLYMHCRLPPISGKA